MKMRVLALAGLTGLALAGASPALAATVSTTDATAPHAYPITIASTLSVSTQHPVFGQTITVAGANYQASTSVQVDLVKQSDRTTFTSAVHTVAATSYPLGTASTNASGSFTLKVTMPGKSAGAGTYLVRGYTHYNGPNIPTQTVYLTAGSSGTGGAGSGGSGSGNGGTAFTGVDIAALVAAGLILVGGGALIASRGRNRVTAGR